MKHLHFPILLAVLMSMVGAMHVRAQVSNDNEDGVYKMDSRMRNDFVPGQVIVKFKDASTIQVRRSAMGKFKAANISAVDKLLQEYSVDEMEKLFSNEVAKPKSQLRKKVAPNGTVVQEKNLDKVFLIKTMLESPDSVLQLAEKLSEQDEVEYAEPNYYVYITADVPSITTEQAVFAVNEMVPTPVTTETEAEVICSNPSQNPLYSQQNNITQQNIQALWDKPIINKKRPVIAILDTGVDITHPDLVDNIWTNPKEDEGEAAYDDDSNGYNDDAHGWNFVENYYDLTDRNGHGTHVAGIAAAVDNGIGIVGANPLALIMPVKVMNDNGSGDVATIARGILYAANNGADVINMSLGGPNLPMVEKEALDKAYQSSVLVASAGNNGKKIYDFYGCMYPAAYYLVLGVQAPDSYSNYDPDGPIYSEDGVDGRNYEVKVPGTNILSTFPGGNYKKLTGTSMSAPLFAGAVSALQMVKEYPSKDVLYGDLIHLNADFSKIFSEDTPRTPKIDLVSLDVDDNVDGNNNIDGQVDVGETINFTPVLRNTWVDANNIQLKLTVDEKYSDFVEIVNPEVDFGWSLSAYGRSAAKTPISVRFSNNIGDNTRIKFKFTANCYESQEQLTKDVYVTVNNMVKLSGLITENRTLTADHVYHVTDNIAVPENVTLTIEPGTRLLFNEGKYLKSFGKLKADGTPGKPIVFTGYKGAEWGGVLSHAKDYDRMTGFYSSADTISYCIIENAASEDSDARLHINDCVYSSFGDGYPFYIFSGSRNTFMNYNGDYCLEVGINIQYLSYSNIINNIWNLSPDNLCNYSDMVYVNYFNNTCKYRGDYWLSYNPVSPDIDKSEHPSYLGTAREDLVRPHIFEMGNGADGFGTIDLSNMPNRPYSEAHGIVWKVVVNGKDAQDEYEDLAPLGVGKHKFEVYFNRPMNKEVSPKISFGVREPYTQNVVDEDGSWNENGTIYTAYKTITGRTMSDGVNRIYVYGAEDNEYFECPYEKSRFNINIQAAGSMATGFSAEAGMGKVNLTWNNDENDFEDAMGYNIYRFTINEAGKADTLCINKEIVNLETTEYTDYDVTPGFTYYYMYKVISTDLKEYDVSNVVAVTQLTSTRGDANGSGNVDVADVITTVNYAAGQQPKPFIFEAADMNIDKAIDILDVIGIIKVILNPNATAETAALSVATYTVEEGVVYVDSPVALAGVQVQLAVSDDYKSNGTLTVADDLKGFETTSAWLSENDYLLLAYNMNGKSLAPGKHALLNIGKSQIAGIRLSDANGHNIEAIGGEATAIDRMGSHVKNVKGVYNMSGQKVTGNSEQLNILPKGVYIINGEKVVK